MEEVVRAQEKLSVLAWDAVGARASCSTCSQAQLSSGFSVAQLTEAVEGAWCAPHQAAERPTLRSPCADASS